MNDKELETLKGKVVVLVAQTPIGDNVELPAPYFGKIYRYDRGSVTLNPCYSFEDLAAVETSSLNAFAGAKAVYLDMGKVEEQLKKEHKNMIDLVRIINDTESGSSSKERNFRRDKIDSIKPVS